MHRLAKREVHRRAKVYDLRLHMEAVGTSSRTCIARPWIRRTNMREHARIAARICGFVAERRAVGRSACARGRHHPDDCNEVIVVAILAVDTVLPLQNPARASRDPTNVDRIDRGRPQMLGQGRILRIVVRRAGISVVAYVASDEAVHIERSRCGHIELEIEAPRARLPSHRASPTEISQSGDRYEWLILVAWGAGKLSRREGLKARHRAGCCIDVIGALAGIKDAMRRLSTHIFGKWTRR